MSDIRESLTPLISGGEGVGVDLVHVPSFATQLAQPGSVFSRVFTDREWEYCHREGQDQERTHASLAARWAAKEAFVKAWSSLLLGVEPPIAPDRLDWAQIEVCHDRWSRPYLRFHGEVAAALSQLEVSLDTQLHWSVSMSHDHDMSIAFVQVSSHLN